MAETYPANYPCPNFTLATNGINNLTTTTMASGRARPRRRFNHVPPDTYQATFSFNLDYDLMISWRAWANSILPESVLMPMDKGITKDVFFTSSVFPIQRDESGRYRITATMADSV